MKFVEDEQQARYDSVSTGRVNGISCVEDEDVVRYIGANENVDCVDKRKRV